VPRTDETLLARAKAMRAGRSPAEAALWSILRAHRFQGVKFTRQVVIGHYIADFVARGAKLVIEIDGDSHAGRERYDAARTVFLESQGYHVIRFTNAEVPGNIEGVAHAIVVALAQRSAPLPSPLHEGERGQRP